MSLKCRLPSTRRFIASTSRTFRTSSILQSSWAPAASRVANIQYYAWALKNRAALMPTRTQVMKSAEIVEEAKARFKRHHGLRFRRAGLLREDSEAVHGRLGARRHERNAARPRASLHASETVPGLIFDNVKDRRLADIWLNGQAFQMYRGTSWMKEPCRGCPRAEIDFGGCRCQAMAFTGDASATDPACKLSPPITKPS